MAGIRIDFVADVGKFIGKTQDVEDALSDVSSSLDEVGNDSDKLEAKFTENFRAVKKAAETAGDTVGTSVKRGTTKATEGVEEFKNAARGKAKEAAASFQGSFDNVASFIQGSLAESLMGFGPAATAAGLAAAAGIGILVTQLQKAAEEQAKFKEETIKFAQALREVDGDINKIKWADVFVEFADQIGDTKEWWELFQDSAKTNLELAKGYATKFGLDFRTVFKGLAGEPEAATKALAALDVKLAAATDEMQQMVAIGTDPLAAAVASGVTELQELRDKLDAASRKTREAAELQNLLAEATNKSTRKERDHAAALLDSMHATEELNDKLDERMGKLEALAKAQMDADQIEAEWIKTQQESAEAAKEISGAVNKQKDAWKLTTEAGQKAREITEDVASKGWDYIASLQDQGKGSEELVKATEAVRAKFVATVKQMGLNETAAQRLADRYGLISKDVGATAVLDTSTAIKSLDDYEARLAQAFGPRSTSLWDNWTFRTEGAVPAQVTVNIPTVITERFDPAAIQRALRWELEEHR